MWVIVGLGNPGIKYKWNRHNIGFQVIDLVAKRHGIKLRRNKFIPALTGEGTIGNEDVILVKPVTYMNRSGLAVKGIQELSGVATEKILIVLDDIDLPWNKLRLRIRGSSGGHKGLRSVIDGLGAVDFPRLRMGIGRGVADAAGVIWHVLGRFSAEEKKQLEEYCNRALCAIDILLDEGIESAMNRFN